MAGVEGGGAARPPSLSGSCRSLRPGRALSCSIPSQAPESGCPSQLVCAWPPRPAARGVCSETTSTFRRLPWPQRPAREQSLSTGRRQAACPQPSPEVALQGAWISPRGVTRLGRGGSGGDECFLNAVSLGSWACFQSCSGLRGRGDPSSAPTLPLFLWVWAGTLRPWSWSTSFPYPHAALNTWSWEPPQEAQGHHVLGGHRCE